MNSTTEFKSEITPCYITMSNMVFPIHTINLYSLYDLFVKTIINTLLSIVFKSNLINDFVKATNNIVVNLIKVGRNNIGTMYYNMDSVFQDHPDYGLYTVIFILFVIYHLINIIVENTHSENEYSFVNEKSLSEKIAYLEREVNFLKKNDQMRENDSDLIIKNNNLLLKNYKTEVNIQFKNIEKQFKKMNKEIKLYE